MIEVKMKDNEIKKMKFSGPAHIVLDELLSITESILGTIINDIPEQENKLQLLDQFVGVFKSELENAIIYNKL